jgi:hypothetical protein
MMNTKTPLPTRRKNMKAISRGLPDNDFLKDCRERRGGEGSGVLVERERVGERLKMGKLGVCKAWNNGMVEINV